MTYRRFLILPLLLTSVALHAQSNAEPPVPLLTNVVDATTHGEGGVAAYSFFAGPGDVTITVEASTDDYSSPVELELLHDRRSLGGLSVVASDSVGRASKTFRMSAREPVVLRVATRTDSHVKLLKYRIALDGAAAFDDVTPVSPAPASAAPAAPPFDAVPAADDGTLDTIAQLLASIPSLPANGTLRIDMRDGTIRLIPLAKVLRLSLQRSK